MALIVQLRVGDSVVCNGPATITMTKRDGQGAKVRVDADETVKIEHKRGAALPVSDVAAKGLSRPRLPAGQ